jgi:hypothetical protein
MNLSTVNKASLIGTGIKYGIPILAIGIGVIVIKKRLKRNPDGTSSKVAPSLKDTVIQKNNLTITTSDAALFANTLYGAMQDIGTDEETIYSTIEKINTKDDMLLVIKAFGMKKYLWGARDPWFGQEYNLIGWLRSELSNKEVAKIKPKFDEWGIPL